MNPMLAGTLLLTGANLALRLVGLGFQVYLSRRIGAAGIGLMQLTLSVSGLTVTAAMAGIRTTAMYLAAEKIGRGRRDQLGPVLSLCFLYSLLCSAPTALGVWHFAPAIAAGWIGDSRTETALRIMAAFLPCVCLSGVMTGLYTAQGRVKALVAIELAEQALSMGLTLLLLHIRGGNDPAMACACVTLGSSGASVFALLALTAMHRRGGQRRSPGLAKKLLKTALPLALADDMRMGISTAENLMVPRRLGLYAGTGSALADYGKLSGMVFPALMFPASILFSLSELLIPELSRCAAAGKAGRIRYLTERSQRAALLYGLGAGGVLFAAAEPLGLILYRDAQVGRLLGAFAILAPMLYLDAVTDAAIKGMGQQVACVRYNTFTNLLDVALLFVLLPRYGLAGYFGSFVITHIINFALSLRRLCRVTGCRPDWGLALRGAAGAIASAALVRLLPRGRGLGAALALGAAQLSLFAGFGFILHYLEKSDLLWLKSLVRPIDTGKGQGYNDSKSAKKGM